MKATKQDKDDNKTNDEITIDDRLEQEDQDVIHELQQKVADLTLGWQRTQADFQNFRRQSEEDRKKLIKTANASLLEEIIPVLDNFQLASKHVPTEIENNNWVIGIKQIEKQLENILGNDGLMKIETIGKQFDPNFHEAIEHVQSQEPEGQIVEEISAGYAFDGFVLRPAKVKVSKGK